MSHLFEYIQLEFPYRAGGKGVLVEGLEKIFQ